MLLNFEDTTFCVMYLVFCFAQPWSTRGFRVDLHKHPSVFPHKTTHLHHCLKLVKCVLLIHQSLTSFSCLLCGSFSEK